MRMGKSNPKHPERKRRTYDSYVMSHELWAVNQMNIKLVQGQSRKIKENFNTIIINY